MSDILSARVAALSSNRSDKSARAFAVGRNARLLPATAICATPSFASQYRRYAAKVLSLVIGAALLGMVTGAAMANDGFALVVTIDGETYVADSGLSFEDCQRELGGIAEVVIVPGVTADVSEASAIACVAAN